MICKSHNCITDLYCKTCDSAICYRWLIETTHKGHDTSGDANEVICS